MKERIRIFLRQCLDTLRFCPVEAALTLFFFVYCALMVEEAAIVEDREAYISLFPLLFSAAFLLNRWLPRGPGRWAYYLSGLVAIPLLWLDLQDWVRTISYFMALALCPLVVCLSRWRRENIDFVSDALHYVKNLFFAGLLTGLGYGLLMAIYFSLRYIFPGLPLGDESKVALYAAMLFFIILLPLIFLTFTRLQEDGFTPESFADILMNYVFSPALLAYTAILYAYFVKILFTWSLPRGGVAYMVFCFALLAVLVKAYQPLLQKRLYDWFYDRFQWISIPALVMFWIGVGYRISQYGLTQGRVYLLVCGAIMTLTVLMFFSKRWGRYLYATVVAVFLLALFTYVPGTTAREVGIDSQRARLIASAEKLDLLDENGMLKREKQPDADSLQAEVYTTLYESFDYLSDENDTVFLRNRCGLVSIYDLNHEVLPDNVEYGRYRTKYAGDSEYENNHFYIGREDSPVNVADYRWLYPVQYGGGERGYHYKNDRDSLWIYHPDGKQLLGESLEAVLSNQMAKLNIPTDTTARIRLKNSFDRFRIYDLEGYRLVFSSASFEYDSLSVLRMTDVSIGYILGKE